MGSSGSTRLSFQVSKFGFLKQLRTAELWIKLSKKRGIRVRVMMGDLIAWLLSFVLLIGGLGILLYQLMCLADLEFDYINPYDTTLRINGSILPEFVVQGSLCLLHLGSGHWFMFLLCVPYLCYNVRSYINRDHLIDVTEIFNHLSREKKRRLYKLGYLVVLLLVSISWMIWSIVD